MHHMIFLWLALSALAIQLIVQTISICKGCPPFWHRLTWAFFGLVMVFCVLLVVFG